MVGETEPDVMSARDELIGRIRGAIGSRPPDRAADYAAIPRSYRDAGALDRAACIDLFADRLEHYQVGVKRCSDVDLAAAISRTLAARGAGRIIIPRDVPGRWLSPGIEYRVDDRLSYDDLDRSDGVLTGCTIAIAVTGTIVLRHGVAEGRRALTLIPDYHLCIVRTNQIVETVPEALRRVWTERTTVLTTISGPSATADIEMTRVRGVHGPRTLDVLLVG
jgi:L-lactate dehydrogenase complex protein LldG